KPLVHFLLIGLALFAADRVRARYAAAEVRPAIEIDAARLAQLRSDWISQTRAEPTPAELDALVRDAVDEEILYREAVGLGLLETDSVVRMRMLQNARFVGLERADEQALFEEAMALGLQDTDPVVRRRLVQRMRMGLAALVRETPPTPEELQAVFEREHERYVLPATLELWHVFFAHEADGSQAKRAAAALARIRKQALAPEAAVRLGDPFLRGHHLSQRSQRELEGVFGPDLPAAVFALPLHAWSEPIESAYGLHLVRVEARVEARAQTLDEVRTSVSEEVYAEREREQLRKALDGLRQHYDVRVAAPAAETPG
ncbi:MAG TPA: peptidyl-prolyl cis-trans isomerase, partial [Myxococcota bacterium]|nr:peptidyl-prolyl cis-trans isomerase [Myxococcota bacterium]